MAIYDLEVLRRCSLLRCPSSPSYFASLLRQGYEEPASEDKQDRFEIGAAGFGRPAMMEKNRPLDFARGDKATVKAQRIEIATAGFAGLAMTPHKRPLLKNCTGGGFLGISKQQVL